MNMIQPQLQTQYNNNKYQVPFKSMKKIKWYGEFNPLKHLNDAEVYNSFKKSEPIKEFFKKYDGIVEFYRDDWDIWDCYNPWFKMNIKYTLEKPEKNWLKRKVQNVKNFVLEFLSKDPYEKHTISIPLASRRSLDLIDLDLKQGVKTAKEAEQRRVKKREHINKLLNE